MGLNALALLKPFAYVALGPTSDLGIPLTRCVEGPTPEHEPQSFFALPRLSWN
jgi:hypothetical protein